MTFTFRPAVRENVTPFIGIAGPTGSGKTKSALLVAEGLTGGEGVFVIDTESRRALHYAGDHTFQHCTIDPPFTSTRYGEAIEAAVAAGAKAIIVDSMSHEHAGPGGHIKQHDAEMERMGGKDSAKFTAWIKPKAQREAFIYNTLLRLNVPLIACFRAKEKLDLSGKDDRGKTKVENTGFQPVAGEELVYEMQAMLVLAPDGEGTPDLNASGTKIQGRFRHIFAGRLSRKTGEQFASWARGENVAPPECPPALAAAGRDVAKRGRAALEEWYRGLSQEERNVALPLIRLELTNVASNADMAKQQQEEGAS